MKESKNLVIGMLCAVVCIMAVAYAAFQTSLKVEGTATIASEWLVEITNVECDNSTTVNIEDGSTTASFGMTLSDELLTDTCTVTITNNGTLPAVVAPNGLAITGEGAEGNIQFEVDDKNITAGKQLAVGASTTYTITGTYVMDLDGDDVPDFIEEGANTKDVTVTVIYEQDLTA